MKNIPQKTTGDSWAADDENNGATGEIKNLVNRAGLALDENDTEQVVKSVARIAGGSTNAMYYSETHSNNTHFLTRTGSLAGVEPLGGYDDGLEIKFLSSYNYEAGSGVQSINIDSLGSVEILETDSNHSTLSNIVNYNTDSIIHCIYINGVFRIIGFDQLTNNYNLRKTLEHRIGQMIYNHNPTYNDDVKFNDGIYEYLLCNGQGISATTYPILRNILGSTTPSYNNGSDGAVFRHIPTNSSRTVGSFEDYAVEDMNNVTLSDSFTTSTRTQSLQFSFNAYQREVANTNIPNVGNELNWGTSGNTVRTTNISHSHTGNVSMVLNTNNFGIQFADETRMANYAIQCYVIARVLI